MLTAERGRLLSLSRLDSAIDYSGKSLVGRKSFTTRKAIKSIWDVETKKRFALPSALRAREANFLNLICLHAFECREEASCFFWADWQSRLRCGWQFSSRGEQKQLSAGSGHGKALQMEENTHPRSF
jgi:hypothetical protein